MKSLKIYCISMNPKHLDLIKRLKYEPVGLGDNFFSDEWYNDKSGTNIAFKNQYYGEYTFHYWLWKNNKINNEGWLGFCQYRKFWKNINSNINDSSFENLNNMVLKKIPPELDKHESILGEPLFVNQLRFSKFIKKNPKKMLLNPSLFFNKNKRTIKFHFDMMHGEGNLDRAILLLDNDERSDFTHFINTEISFNPQNMFLCRKKNILLNYYNSLFPWLARCETIFEFEKRNIYGLKRIYGFLAERYMSYWFKKYTKFGILPIHFKDLSDYLL